MPVGTDGNDTLSPLPPGRRPSSKGDEPWDVYFGKSTDGDGQEAEMPARVLTLASFFSWFIVQNPGIPVDEGPQGGDLTSFVVTFGMEKTQAMQMQGNKRDDIGRQSMCVVANTGRYHISHCDGGFEIPRPRVLFIADASFLVPHGLEPRIRVRGEREGFKRQRRGFRDPPINNPHPVTILSHKISRIYAGKARPPWSSVCRSASTHRVSPVCAAARTNMPKDTLPPLPLSGLFAVAKPSGPTSMAIINDVKNLINTSSLFVEQEKLAARKEGKNEKPKRRKWKSNRDMVKIGQGGTLDPLAGESTEHPFRSHFPGLTVARWCTR